jgi:hypothetical protein
VRWHAHDGEGVADVGRGGEYVDGGEGELHGADYGLCPVLLILRVFPIDTSRNMEGRVNIM